MIKVSKKSHKTSLISLCAFALAAALLAFLTGCAVDPEYDSEGHGYAIEWRHDHLSSNTSSIEYQSPELLAQNEIDQAQREHRAPDLSHVPAGGRVTVHLHGHNTTAGNPKNYNFTVSDNNGNVVKQETGRDVSPSQTRGPKASAPVYEATHTMDLDRPVNGQFKVNVANHTDNSKEEFTVRSPSPSPSSNRVALPPGAKPEMTR